MNDETSETSSPGIGRLNFFLARVMMVLVMVVAFMLFGPESRLIGPMSLTFTVFGIVLDVMRLRNIGVSQWFVFLKFIPYVGLLFSISLQSAQTGWVKTRRLDRAGWAILATHAAIIGVMILLVYRKYIDTFGLSFLP